MRKSYSVIQIDDNGDVDIIYRDLTLPAAISTAKSLSKNNDKSVFIRRYRQSDGQVMYYNRDGFSPTGVAW